MLRPDGSDADSRQPGHGAAGSSTTDLVTSQGQQFPTTSRLTPSPHCSPISNLNMLDRGSESRLRRIWDDDDDDNANTSRKPTRNQGNTTWLQPSPPDDRHQEANNYQNFARDVLNPSSSQNLRNLKAEIERMRNLETLREPVASRTDLETSLALLQFNRIDSQHTRTASDLQPFRPRAVEDARSKMRSQNDVPSVTSVGKCAPANPSFSIWSTYGTDSNNQHPSYNQSPARLNSNHYTGANESQMLPFRPRASSEAAPTNAIYRKPASQTSTSCPTYPQQLQATSHIPGINTHNAINFKTAHNSQPIISHQPQQQPRIQKHFQPMQAVLTANNPHAFTPPLAHTHQPAQQQTQLSSRFSSRYHGMHTESNASADYLSPEENAGLWLTNLPPDVTHHELLTSIRNMGRIWCSYVNQPDFQQHVTAAAKVVFFQPPAALRLLHFAATHGLSIRGYRVKVTQNRIKTPAQPLVGNMSRVLIITGQSTFVNAEALVTYFTERFVFQLDEVRELISLRGRTVVEFRFGSFRCQAQMGKMSLEKDQPSGLEKVEFGEDPCEVGEITSSLAVAMQRIAGIGTGI